MAREPKSQRTEKPTRRRLKKAREQGNVPRSQEVSGAMVLAGFLVFAYVMGPDWLERIQKLLSTTLTGLDRPDLSVPSTLELFVNTGRATTLLLLPPLGMVTVAGLAGKLLQGPPPFSFEPLKPTADRLNPVKGLKKIVALKNWVELLKSILKVTLYGVVAYTGARDAILNPVGGGPGAEGTLLTLTSMAGRVIFRVAVVAAGLAVLDVLFRRYDHARELMMTKKEVKDEHKELEGDPLVRARMRQKQMALARSRMMADVPNATVVVTNPTHVAVALRYTAGETDAPEVVAKGRALLAERIRKIATEHRVPIVSDPPLARALYRAVPVGAQIPAALFRAVAEVLALVLTRKSGKTRPSGPSEESRP
jgi:flagellar biosynthetic protein FlhB